MCSAPKKLTSTLGTPRLAVYPRNPALITMIRLENISKAAECLCLVSLDTTITEKLAKFSGPKYQGHPGLFIPSTQVRCILSCLIE